MLRYIGELGLSTSMTMLAHVIGLGNMCYFK